MSTLPWAPEPTPVADRPAVRAGSGRLLGGRPDPWTVGIPALAAGLVALGVALGWRGGDMPAQIYRVQAVRVHGLALWDSQWFAGHWMLGYSVLEPALAALIGLSALSVISAAVAAAGFHRLMRDHFSTGAARAAAVTFAVSVIVETAIGQIPFLAGEAVGLWSCVALSRRRPWPAAVLAVVSSLLSPLSGAFVALAAGAAALTLWWPRNPPGAVPAGAARWQAARVRLARPGAGTAVATLLGVGVPLGLVGLLFPGQGPMPFSAVDCGWYLLVALFLINLTPLHERVLRTGYVLFALVALASLEVPSALGGNVGRIEDAVALPLAVALLWEGRARLVRWRWLLAAALSLTLVSSQWAPAWGDMTGHSAQPWTDARYYAPLTGELHRLMGPGGRVEVVPTADHWEAAYVAPSVALARGWERQLDVADNPIFYAPGQLTDASYLDWLVDNGVRYVALPAAPLDFAGQAEGQLVAAGVPGLQQVWSNADWRLYRVDRPSGIVSGPGYLAHIDGSKITVMAEYPGQIEVRVHDNDGWQVTSGVATIEPSPAGWILVNAVLPGPIDLSVGLAVP
jgi:hypothetical protein